MKHLFVHSRQQQLHFSLCCVGMTTPHGAEDVGQGFLDVSVGEPGLVVPEPQVTGRVRTGASALTGAPIIDLISLARARQVP